MHRPIMIKDSQLKDEIRMLTTQLGRIIQEVEGLSCYRDIEKLRTLAKKVRLKHDAADIRVLDRGPAVGIKPVIFLSSEPSHGFSHGLNRASCGQPGMALARP